MSLFRYQALGPLQAGEGSRAFLGLAINAENKARPVVLIWVPEAAEKDSNLLEKVRRETEHAAKLDHPHIVTVLGFAKLDEGHARVVEFADGESLRKVLEACKKLTPRITARIILDACTAVHYAHVAGNDDGVPLVHGDLRPETILVSFQGITKVTGYGALAFAPRELGGQRVKGRRVHSAPEQVIGGREAVSIPTDVYLLGLTLYECLAGAVPWAEQGDFFDHAVLTLPLPPASPGDVPEAFEAIIQKACAKKALDRYPTPLAMRDALEAAAGGDVASDEELARFLEGLFPQSHQLRADRRHTIDAGIADFVRRQWAEQERRETLPMMRAIEVPASMIPPGVPAPKAAPPTTNVGGEAPRPVAPPPAAAPFAPAEKPKPPERAWTQPDEEEEPAPEGSSTPWLVALALFIAVVGGWGAWKKANSPIPRPPVVDAGSPARLNVGTTEGQRVGSSPDAVDASSDETEGISPKPALELGDAGAAAVLVDAGAAVLAGGQPTGAQPKVEMDAGQRDPAEGEVAVALQSSPGVELMLEGKSLGHTPWSGRLPPGRKVFTLQNKGLGINATRAITVRGEPIAETFVFERGGVSVKAPPGAGIFIDGNRVGTSPPSGEIRDIPVYEGVHRIQVTVGQSKWSESFTLSPGQRVWFNVELSE